MARSLIAALILICFLALLGASGPAPNPQEAARLNNIGVAYMNQQLFEKALKAFEEAAANDPALEVTTVNRGVALLNLQRLDEAKTLLEKAVKSNPNDAYAWYNLGLLAKNTGDTDAAITDFHHARDVVGDDADIWYFLGSVYVQANQYERAINAFQQALLIDPHHASAQFGLARAYQQSGQVDAAHEAMKKFQYITQNKLGTPISLAYGEQGKYSRAEESPLAPQKVPPQIEVRFVDVTNEAGIGPQQASTPEANPSFGPGACFLDYDGDGLIDLFVADNGSHGGMSLYHNLGHGKFEEVTRTAGLDPNLRATGCTAGDYDNDGAVDLVLSFIGRVMLLHNEKNGTFRDVTQSAKIEANGANAGVAFVDYDHDGDLDLFVAQVPDYEFRVLRRLGGGVVWQKSPEPTPGTNSVWRNNGNGTFTDVTASVGMKGLNPVLAAIGTDYNNDRAVDLLLSGKPPVIFENPREGAYKSVPWTNGVPASALGMAVLDFDHDGWMDLAFTHWDPPGITLWRNNLGKNFEQVPLPETNWVRAYGVAAVDFDNDGWVDLVAVGETKDGKGEVRLFRNLGPDGWKDVTAETGLDKIQLKEPRAIIVGDYENDGAADLLITQNHGPAVLLRNEGGNKNNSLRLVLKGLNDNKSAIGTKVEIFSDGLRQKFEVYGSSGYLGQNSPYLTIGLGQSKVADVVRMLWPTGVLQDEIGVAANTVQNFTEMDRRGSSCPTLFAWDGHAYRLVGDMLGAGVVGHWIAAGDGSPQGLKPASSQALNGTAEAVPYPAACESSGGRAGTPVAPQTFSAGREAVRFPGPIRETSAKAVRNIARPTEAIKLDRASLREKDGKLSFRFMEPLEESVYLDQVQLLAVDHPADVDVYPNEYFASNPPYPPFKVVFSNSNDARPPVGAWDEHGHDVLPDLLAHRYFGDFKVLSFMGFTDPHSLELDLGEPYRGGPLWLLMHGEIEYFSATSMYAADQAQLRPLAPYVEALTARRGSSENGGNGKWVRVVDDLGFPAGGARTMTADLSGKLPLGTRRIRITTNLQIYWDSILISRTNQDNRLGQRARLTRVPLLRADLNFHGFPLKIEDQPPGNVKYIYEKASVTGPYTRPAGAYTRYGDVRPLLESIDDEFVVFGSGDEIALDFDPATLPGLPRGWVRDYFFVANGYEKDMDFYAYHGDTVDPLPFRDMRAYPYPGQSFPSDTEHMNYLLEYNTRFLSGNEASGFSFRYPE